MNTIDGMECTIESRQMTIVIGSTNPVKLRAVKNNIEHPSIQVIAYASDSEVAAQPLSDEQTRLGAINRAKNSLSHTDADIGIGLEAGIVFLEDKVYLSHWGALLDKHGNTLLTNAPIIELPGEFKKGLLKGKSLETLMHQMTGVERLGRKEGAIGVFTNNALTREKVLTDLVKVLLTQYQFYHEKKPTS